MDAVAIGHCSSDRQTKAAAFHSRIYQAIKAIENTVLERIRNARPGVCDRQQRSFTVKGHGNIDFTARLSIFNRVVDQAFYHHTENRWRSLPH